MQNSWEGLRAEIDGIINNKNINPKEFRQLRVTEDWKAIEEKLYTTFCKLDSPTQRPVWLWEHFKRSSFSIVSSDPCRDICELIDGKAMVWFIVNGEKGKLWFFEGKISAILTVIEESCYIDELYIASKKFDWLICLNHHDHLIATGEIMPEKLRAYQEQNNR